MKRTTKNSKSYNWGDGCTAWQFVNTPSLSVIRETMPPKTAESLHKHSKSQQFFYVLEGVAVFELNGENYTIKANEGMHVNPGQVHRIVNATDENLELLVISEPHSHADRIEIS
ncbi:MAG: cupin domain-containing protein [Flavobacteriales bacterium]|nr:cupin domain-containing protein [Flavobacteriales bacterium]